MEVKIGVQHAPRELVLETNDPADELEQALRAALEQGGVFAVSDDKGGKVVVPAKKIAYVEFGGNEVRRVGFGKSSGPNI